MNERLLSRIDFNLVGAALLLAIIGAVAIYSATFFSSGDTYLQRQMIWIALGVVMMILFAVIDYRVFFDIAIVLYVIGLLLLLYLVIWGRTTANVQSWIHIGAFQFQPSEFMKIFTALMVARYFDAHERNYLTARSLGMVMLIIGAPLALIIIQPDFGTAASFFPLIAAAMFLGGIRLRYWVIGALALLIAIPIGWNAFLKPYQKERILIFLDPERDPLGSGYQVTQAKIAIGSGGITGKGFKQGTQAALEYLPARHTDFIFAVLAEEWGFVGVAVVLGLYLYLVIASLQIARNARDRGGTFLVVCLIAFFIFHIVINVAMQIGLLPTTGIPLPLLSYGGSSTMMFFMAIGLILNVEARRFVNV